MRDAVYLHYYNGLGQGTCISSGGLEVSKVNPQYPPDGNFHADTFDLSPLAWQDTSYVYWYGWNPSQAYIDRPCRNPPTINCLNGLYVSASDWMDNKP